MWLIAYYQPSALFSLRPANATTSGGKTLITPTPFALKMALLDAAIRCFGLSSGKNWFPALRDLTIAIQLPQHLSVISMFCKVRRPVEIKDAKTAEAKIARKKVDKDWPWDSSISFREFVQYAGPIAIAFFQNTQGVPLLNLATQINYIGKRGSFVQFIEAEEVEQLTESFTVLNPKTTDRFWASGTLQLLDDCGHKMKFEHADIYDPVSIAQNEPNGRLQKPVILPYRLIQSHRSFMLYERLDI